MGCSIRGCDLTDMYGMISIIAGNRSGAAALGPVRVFYITDACLPQCRMLKLVWSKAYGLHATADGVALTH